MTTPGDSTPGGAVNFPVNALEEALAAAMVDATEQTDAPADTAESPTPATEVVDHFISALRAGELWVPLPEGSGVQEDGSVALPTLDLNGKTFVPVFTSAEQLSVNSAELPYTVVPASDLASALPDDVGMALNPGNEASVPIYPETVSSLRSQEG